MAAAAGDADVTPQAILKQYGTEKTLLVRNLAAKVTVDSLTSFFTFVGKVERLQIFPEVEAGARFALAAFTSEKDAKAAMMLHGTSMLGETLSITEADFVPEVGVAVVEEDQGPDLQVSEPDPEQAARTVHVSNIAAQTTAEDLREALRGCGEIAYCQLNGDGSFGTRSAFVEFATIDAAGQALALGENLQLHGNIIRVRPSQSPTPRVNKEEEALQKRLRRVVERIERRVHDRENRSRDRYSRSRSPHHSSRNRSPRRHGSRHHSRSDRYHDGRHGDSRHHSRRSGDRSSDRRSRDRSRYHHSRRTHSRSKSPSDRKRRRDRDMEYGERDSKRQRL